MTRNSTSIDQETLVAYVDNELPPERATEVERALASDAEALNSIRLMRLGGAAAAHAFDQALEDPLPPHLLAALGPRLKTPVWSPNLQARGLRWRMTLVACLAAFAIGFAGGMLLRGSDSGFAPAAAKGQDALSTSFESALFVALGSGVPGQGYDYGNDAIGRGRIVLGKGFVTGFGSSCREFGRVESRGTVQSQDNGLACRTNGGGWAVMIVSP